jgi:4-diphosphocytidyl-2C-methyl-D-erythritol kinase
MVTATKKERFESLLKITLDLTKAECPCATCMGGGCGDCAGTGADLESLRSIRRAFADALDEVASAHGADIYQIAQCLRVPPPIARVPYNASDALAAGMLVTCTGPAGGGGGSGRGGRGTP